MHGNIFFILNQSGHSLYLLDKSGKLDSVIIGASTNFLFLDKSENLWVATEQGLVRVFTNGFQNFGKTQLNAVWSMVEDAKGNMWFGEFYTKKLKRFDGKKYEEQKINYSLAPDLSKGDLGDFYFGGGRDRLGNLYFPSVWGIKKYDGKRFSMFSGGDPKQNHRISMNFLLDTVANIIVSGTGGGVNVIDLKTGKDKYYGSTKGIHRNGFVKGVGKDGKSNYWLGTGNGLAVFDLKRDSITKNFTRDLGNFPYFGTICVFGDFRGNIWAGSAKALLFYDEKRDTFIEVAPNIIRTNVNCLVGYKDEHLVIGANDGIYFLDLKAFYAEGKTIVRQFNQHNGYTGIEPNQNSLYVDSKKNIWVAASDIVTKITPSELDMKSNPLEIFITEINNQRVRYEDYGKVITLSKGINTAKIRFEAVGFERPSDTEFSYKTEDGNWSEWRTEDFAILDNLSSGTYTFLVLTRPAGTDGYQLILLKQSPPTSC